MATSELKFQSKLVEAINEAGGHAFKSSNRFKAGVPDIHYTIAGHSGFIECKYVRYNRLKREHEAAIVVDATPLQIDFARKERAAGGDVLFVVYVQWNDCFLISKFVPGNTLFLQNAETIRKGQTWPKQEFLRWLEQ